MFKRRSKRFLSIVLSAAMLLTMAPVAAFAEDATDVTSLPAAQDGVITLTENVTLSEAYTVNEGENITLDLGGHTLTLSGSTSVADAVYEDGTSAALLNNGTLTVKNGTITGSGDACLIINKGTLALADDVALTKTGKGNAIDNLGGSVTSDADITVNNEGYTAIITYGGNITINGGDIASDSNSDDTKVVNAGISVFNRGYNNTSAGADVTINGGTITSDIYAVSTNNLYSGGNDPSNVTINAGTLTSTNTAIYWPSAGTLTIGTATDNAGPTITSTKGSAVEVCSGTLNVNGGTLNGGTEMTETDSIATDESWVKAFRANSGSSGIGDGITIIARRANGYVTAPLNVNIAGGTFTSAQNYGVRYMDCNLASEATQLTQNVSYTISGGDFSGKIAPIDAQFMVADAQQFISGGTFTTDVSDYVVENHKCEQVEGSYQVKAMESELVVKPSTDEGKTSATLEGQYAGADTTIEGGAEGDESAVTNEGVTIDLTTDSTSSTTSAALTVTAETAKSLATNKAPSLSVKTDVGTVALNQTAVAKMGEVTEPVVVSVEKTTPDPSAENIAAEYTISVTSNGKNLLPDGADNGTVTITVPVSEKNLQPWCVVDSNGTTIYAEKLPVVASTEDSLTFTIGHLSKIQLLKADPESGTAIASITKKDGTKTYYSDVNALQTAVSSAIAGDVIDLLDDVTATSAVNSGTITAVFHVNEGVTINGNGHTLAYSGTGVINHIINVNKSADAAAINDLVIDATNAKYGVQFYCTNGGSLNNVTINNGTYAAVNINGAQNVTITDSTLNPGESAYANIDYSMGKNVTTIPSIALDNVSMKNGIYQVWADETTITNMKTQMGNNPSNEEVLENVKDNIDYTSPSGGSLQITVNFGSEAGGTVTDRVDSSYQPPYTGDHNYAVTVARTQGGSVSIDKADQYANAGETITFTVTPDKGYSIDKVTVTQGSKAIDVTDNSDSTYSFTMPKGPVTITVTFTESDQPEPTPELPFTDVHEDDWYYQSVLYVYNEGLMTGTAADTFSPGITTTRGMIVSILYRQEGEPAVTTDAGFADVVDGAYYEDAVNWAAEEGIVNGYSDTAFGPNDAITREQMAAILMNYAEYKGQDVSARADLSGYTDADTVSGWASDAVQWANAEGLINGMSDTELAPKGHATRAQVAAILQRFLAE